jgi:hypothetical protein
MIRYTFNASARPYPPLNPVFSYFGSKWNHVGSGKYPAPLHPLIIEPFAGSACYSLHYHWNRVILVDINPTIIEIWNYLKRVDETLYDLPDKLTCVPADLEPGAQALIGFWLARAASSPRQTASPWIERYPKSGWRPEIKRRLVQQAPYIQHWGILPGTYRSFSDNIEATWFIDAPYQFRPRSYKHSNIDYRDLADFVLTRRGQVIVCEGGPANWLPFGDIGLDEVWWYRKTTKSNSRRHIMTDPKTPTLEAT